jgi:hypothetical protein
MRKKYFYDSADFVCDKTGVGCDKKYYVWASAAICGEVALREGPLPASPKGR